MTYHDYDPKRLPGVMAALQRQCCVQADKPLKDKTEAERLVEESYRALSAMQSNLLVRLPYHAAACCEDAGESFIATERKCVCAPEDKWARHATGYRIPTTVDRICSENDRTTFYVASKIMHAGLWRDLRKAGYRIISSWIDHERITDKAKQRELAETCIREASEADVTVVLCHPGENLKGVLVEIGAALASGRTVRCLGKNDMLRMVFPAHPRWVNCTTHEEAFAPLKV